ncbi:MAG: hypothetical protein D3926_15830 [Desulfobacteraceae bacterium]|nr:MAG: hypothetical protein D3926_15830 [Desulfobacteraceae bacterium]
MHINRAKADISKEIMSQSYEIKKISDITLAYARKLTNSQHGFVSSIDTDTLENVGHTLTDMFGAQCRVKDQRFSFPVGKDGTYPALWGVALNTKTAFFTNTPSSHAGAAGLPEGHIPLDNFLAVPVLIENEAAGLITLANSEHGYSSRDIDSVTRLSEIYALALHRYRYELERDSMENQLRQMQRIEAIGTLAGGIAHDFNNILFPLVGFVELLMEDLPAQSPLQESAREVMNASLRAKDLVKQILTFSRQGEQELKPLKLQVVIKEVMKLLRASIPKTVEFRLRIDEDCGQILADPTQVHQVIMNLVTNAHHAMQDKGGVLTLELEEVDIYSLKPEVIGLKPGRYALMTVSDTGEGIQAEVLDKIFDPYFTTKPKDKGTGLGLSVVRGIVKTGNGDIRAASTPGKGTTIEVFLPLISKAALDETQDPSNALPTGDESILLVDDEAAVLKVMTLMLERLGYRFRIPERPMQEAS